MSENTDTIALTLDRDLARRALNGECLPVEALRALEGQPSDTEVLLILRRDSTQNEQEIANAIVLALGITPRAFVIDADAPIPEGFVRNHFVEIGDDPTRTTRGQMVYQVIPPVTFCE